jgi:SAM-dependent methyltransferase
MPRYLLRLWVVKRLIRKLRPGTFVEIGAASGHAAQWMSEQCGMRGTAVEISPSALEMMRERLDGNERVSIFGRDSCHLPCGTQADLILSMEVLEHIEDDDAALQGWFNLIRPGGHLLLSVPAHQSKFSAEDEMVGHFRRYDKEPLRAQLMSIGFEEPRVLSYGFPLGLLLKVLRTRVASGVLKTDQRTRQERTEASGVERMRWLSLRWLLNDVCMLPFNLMQLPFLSLDWSDGYIALARKPRR